MSEQIVVPQDKPQLTMQVSVFEKKVVQHFPHPLEYLALEADEAVRLGYTLIERGWEARPELKPLDGNKKHDLVERHRRTLTNRIALHFNTLRERKKMSNRELAEHVVELMIKEVF